MQYLGILILRCLYTAGKGIVMKPLRLLLIFLIFFVSAAVAAPEVPPDELAKRTTEEVLTILRQNSEIKQNRQKLFALIDAKVLPHFDFTHMTKLAVGKNWMSIKPQQQQMLVKEFRTLLVRTYSTALTNYKDQKVVFKPLRSHPGQSDVTVKTDVIQGGATPVPIDYAMEKTASGWKVYDIVVDNVSLVMNYRGSFTEEIRSGGVEKLIKSLQDKNQKGGAGE